MKRSVVGQYVRTQRHYYEVFVRCGWLLPSYGSPMVNRMFLDGVRSGQFWCPNVKDGIVTLQCVNPPPKQILINYFKMGVHDAAEDNSLDAKTLTSLRNLISYMEEGYTPDNKYMFVLLSRYPGKSCEVFQKGYRYQAPKRATNVDEYEYSNSDGFFDDLPERDEKEIRKHNQMRMNQKVKLSLQKEDMIERHKLLGKQIKKMDSKISKVKANKWQKQVKVPGDDDMKDDNDEESEDLEFDLDSKEADQAEDDDFDSEDFNQVDPSSEPQESVHQMIDTTSRRTNRRLFK